MRKSLPLTWSASKIAVDGDCIRHIQEQLENLPTNATDLIVSVGGNDARQHTNLLTQIGLLSDLPKVISGPLASFRATYREMLQIISKLDLRSHVCTIYTAVPFEDPRWRQYAPHAISMFNSVIVEEAASLSIPVFRLEEVCTEDNDFAATSPIEPSSQGGQKIVDHILSSLS
jgi:hypothetical protein